MKILPDRDRLKLDGKTFFQWTALDALKGAAPLARYGHSAGLLSGRYYTIFGGYVATKSGASLYHQAPFVDSDIVRYL